MKIEVTILDNASTLQDLCDLIEVFADVFETDTEERPPSEHLKLLLDNQYFLAIVAKVDGWVVGGLTIYIITQYISTRPLAYIYDFAVLTQFQRKGIGKRLVEFTREYCRTLGCEEIFVQVERVDLFAQEFYRSTRPTSEDPVIHFSYRLD